METTGTEHSAKQPKVFISYSHKDEIWKDNLLPHLKTLAQAGVAMEIWEDRRIDAGEIWYPAIQNAMDEAAVAILLVSANYLASGFCIKEEVPYLIERQEKEGMLLIPVLIKMCPWKIHRWLANRQMLPRDGKCLAIDYPGDQADIIFTDVAERVYGHFAKFVTQPAKATILPKNVQSVVRTFTAVKVTEEVTLLKPEWPLLPAACIDLSHLPQTGSILFGREEELTFLDEIWASLDKPGAATRVLAFKAQGGVGKSALINRWLGEMKRDNFRGAMRIFGWSFYSQGVRDQGTASGDNFLAAALRFFGDEVMAGSAASSWDKGARLAHLVGAERNLLVLDGMEPLQSAHRVDRGKLRDPGLESLLRGLARQSAGFCLITTREPLAELGQKAGIAERDLEQITPKAGRALLRAMHIFGADAELEQLAERFGPHALAISLLAVYLREHGHGTGPARQLELLPGKEAVDCVLAGFEKLLADGAELEALRLLGFFDRPADEGCLGALRNEPVIPGLTDHLAGMAEADWPRILARLEELHLLHIRKGETGKRFVDTHPLIREHFSQQIHEQNPDAWRTAHRRLYEHLCETTKEGDQPTLEDLQPLYQAVAHGCQAGMQQETCDKIYLDRITRGNKKYVIRKLGAFGSDLGAVACFFEHPWSRVSPALTEAFQAWLLAQAAYRLRALGRLTEAIEPLRAALEMRIKQENWKSAAIVANNLSQLELTLGDVVGAMGNAEQSVTYADHSSVVLQRISRRTTHADVMHQAGRRTEAETLFREAEQMQIEWQPEYPLLYSFRGFNYGDLLLAGAERAAWQLTLNSDFRLRTSDLSEACGEVEKRAIQTLKIAVDNKLSLLTIALDHLTLGCAALYESILSKSKIVNRKSEIQQAVSGLRHASHNEFIVRGLLTRAWLRFIEENRTGPGSAQEDLDEAWEIAERGQMRLFMADIHLYRVRLFFRETPYPWESPQADLAVARKLIEECGYWRRKEELEDAEMVIII